MMEDPRRNLCSIYSDQTGRLIRKGYFQLRGEGRAARSAELRYVGTDNVRIFLEDQKVLDYVGPSTSR